jgi:hypothetical protein
MLLNVFALSSQTATALQFTLFDGLKPLVPKTLTTDIYKWPPLKLADVDDMTVITP